jgi:hypothetical protein
MQLEELEEFLRKCAAWNIVRANSVLLEHGFHFHFRRAS